MTGLEIYLYGWLLTAVVSGSQCESNHAVSAYQCVVFTTAVSAAWPVTVPMMIHDTLKDKPDKEIK